MTLEKIIICFVIYGISLTSGSLVTAAWQPLVTLMTTALGSSVLILLTRKSWLRSTVPTKKRLYLAPFIAVSFYLGQFVYLQLLALVRLNVTSHNTSALLRNLMNQPLWFLYICIFAPIMEEIIFRHLLNRLIPQALGFSSSWISASISSLLFGLAHSDQLLFMPVYFFIGLSLCWIYQRTRNLTLTIATHCCYNTFALFLNVIILYLAK